MSGGRDLRDAALIRELHQQASAALAQGCRCLTIDLTATSTADSRLVAVVIVIVQQARRAAAECRLRASSVVLTLLALYRVRITDLATAVGDRADSQGLPSRHAD